MHPTQLLDACTDMVAQLMRFEHPADSVLSRFFRERRFGQRERATLAETAYRLLRQRLLFEFMARSAPILGPKLGAALPRRLAILAFAAPRDHLKAALQPAEWDWLGACDAQLASGQGLLEPHRHNLPPWLAHTLKTELGEQFWPFVQSMDLSAAMDLRVNVLKLDRDRAASVLAENGITAQATPYCPWGLRVQGRPSLTQIDAFKQGFIEVQDEGSQLLALLTGAKRGEMVADFCAGAGGKTLALGAMMRNTGRLYAFDTSAKRLAQMKPRLARSGLSNVHPVGITSERDERIKRLAGKMDRVLVDAPCSGLGTLRRNPDLKWRQKEADVIQLASLQGSILASAARMVKAGGRLVYATCSVLSQENEAVARAFETLYPDFVPLSAGELLADLNMAQAGLLCSGPSDHPSRYLRLWPHVHDTDGFFAAVWQRK